MKAFTFFFCLVLFMLYFAPLLHSQEEESPLTLRTRYPGYIINNYGDTIKGLIEFKTLIANQFNVWLYEGPTSGKPLEKFKPKDINSYKVDRLMYVSLPFSGKGFSKKNTFMIRVIDGPISLYEWYYDESLMVDDDDLYEAAGVEKAMDVDLEEGIVQQLFAVKNDGKPVDFTSLKFSMKFKKLMSEYVADYRELSAKIANKEEGYKYENYMEIIKEYNGWYLKNH